MIITRPFHCGVDLFRRDKKRDGVVPAIHGHFHMERRSVLRLRHARGCVLAVRDGELWITHEGDAQDTVVSVGQAFSIERDGVTLAQALRASEVTLTVPARAPGLIRVFEGVGTSERLFLRPPLFLGPATCC